MSKPLSAILRIALVSCFACLSFSSYAREIVIPPSPLLAHPGDIQRFYGQVKAIDGATRTVTVDLGSRFVVRVQAATKISLKGGAAASFDSIKLGDGLDVVARRGTGGSWTALKITLHKGAHFPDVISASMRDQTITGPALRNIVSYAPHGMVVGRKIGHPSGEFLLSVRPDGTVASARVIKSMGSKKLDDTAIRRLLKVKFKPGVLSEARVGVSFGSE